MIDSLSPYLKESKRKDGLTKSDLSNIKSFITTNLDVIDIAKNKDEKQLLKFITS